MLIDTHSHIYSEEFDNDRDEVIARAEEAGVGLILLPAIDRESYDRQEKLASSRQDLFRQMMGLHPTSVVDDPTDDLHMVEERLFSTPDKYIAVGEIGLDLYWDTSRKQQQMEALEKQVYWAEMLDKPIVLHVRNAYDEVFGLLEKHGSMVYKGIMHCFSGTLDDAWRAIDMGFHLGIGGVVTYKKSSLPDIVAAIPLEKIVLETDAPYLAPVPYRGRRNETAYITCVADRIAEIKGCNRTTVDNVTTQNAMALFNM